VVEALLEATNDKRWQVVKEAITSLGKLKAPVSGRLLAFLSHEIADVRIAAASALGEIGNFATIPELKNLLTDPDTGVQKAASHSINKVQSH